MPLDKSGSKASKGAGKPREQAAAIAEAVRRRAVMQRLKKAKKACGCGGKCDTCKE